MPTISTIMVHPDLTENRDRQYQFTPKHHGADRDAAQWLPSLTFAEEFAVFNSADEHDLSDGRGWLYGVQKVDDSLRVLGTWGQQIAEFPFAEVERPWHGYPIWPINELGPSGRRGERMRPDREVFEKMERATVLTARERKRLFKGDHA